MRRTLDRWRFDVVSRWRTFTGIGAHFWAIRTRLQLVLVTPFGAAICSCCRITSRTTNTNLR
jgi:hypothetical protein